MDTLVQVRPCHGWTRIALASVGAAIAFGASASGQEPDATVPPAMSAYCRQQLEAALQKILPAVEAQATKVQPLTPEIKQQIRDSVAAQIASSVACNNPSASSLEKRLDDMRVDLDGSDSPYNVYNARLERLK